MEHCPVCKIKQKTMDQIMSDVYYCSVCEVTLTSDGIARITTLEAQLADIRKLADQNWEIRPEEIFNIIDPK